MTFGWKGSRFFLLVIPSLTVLFCEFLIYYMVQVQCDWPKSLGVEENQLRALIIADTHLLGPFRGHWFDKLRREWQMSTSFQAATFIHSPDVVFLLGDVFDEGEWVNQKEYENYVNRFHYLFPAYNMQVIVGNHDVGFHNQMQQHKPNLMRFYKSFNISSSDFLKFKGIPFVTVNSMAMEKDGCTICKEAERKILDIAGQLDPSTKPVLLQHYPLYRTSDATCAGEDAAPINERNKQFRQKIDCLSESSSKWLLETLKPSVVFSGHTHNGCLYKHFDSINEYSVPSFSWRNRDNPSYLLATFSPNNNYDVFKCFIPRESTVIWLYMAALLVFVGMSVELLYRRYRQQLRLKAA